MSELFNLFELPDAMPGDEGGLFGGYEEPVTDVGEAAPSAFEEPGGHTLGASPPSWYGSPHAGHQDWDSDGIPNYADHWNGPGSGDPFTPLHSSPGASQAPGWQGRPWADQKDWDNDGIPNYADHYDGPGAHAAPGSSGSASSPGWYGRPWADKQDWDSDKIPNYADHWSGPGAHKPPGFLGAAAGGGSELAFAPGIADEAPEQIEPELQSMSEQDGDTLAASDEVVESGIATDATAPEGTSADDSFLGALTAGDPSGDAEHWEIQEGQSSCAVAAQTGILESILGREIPESEVAQVAYENGWYDPERGTSPEHMGKILEAFGVPVERTTGTSLSHVFDALARGEKVLIGLDANEIWYPEAGPDGRPVELPDGGHAVWVTGMHYAEDSGRWSVVLNDTGTWDGQEKHVTVEDFVNAWDDFDRLTVVTDLHGEVPDVA